MLEGEWENGISAGTIVLAAVALLLDGTSLYRFMKAEGNTLTIIWKVFLAWRKRKPSHPSDPRFLNEYHMQKSHIQIY